MTEAGRGPFAPQSSQKVPEKYLNMPIHEQSQTPITSLLSAKTKLLKPDYRPNEKNKKNPKSLQV